MVIDIIVFILVNAVPFGAALFMWNLFLGASRFKQEQVERKKKVSIITSKPYQYYMRNAVLALIIFILAVWCLNVVDFY